MKIKIEYNAPEQDVLEIGFYRGKTLLHNVFYDIKGLSDDELLELKKEAIAKFCAVFPEISKKDVLKGFSAVDDKMQKLYHETFPNGGWRGGGRPKGSKSNKPKTDKTELLNIRLTLDEKEFLKTALKSYRNTRKDYTSSDTFLTTRPIT